MTNTKLLREKIDKSGYKMGYIASQIGITPQGFYLKLNNTHQFKAAEIQMLCKLLDIDSEEMKAIFFATEVAE